MLPVGVFVSLPFPHQREVCSAAVPFQAQIDEIKNNSGLINSSYYSTHACPPERRPNPCPGMALCGIYIPGKVYDSTYNAPTGSGTRWGQKAGFGLTHLSCCCKGEVARHPDPVPEVLQTQLYLRGGIETQNKQPDDQSKPRQQGYGTARVTKRSVEWNLILRPCRKRLHCMPPRNTVA